MRKGQKHSPEALLKIGAASRGRVQSAEARAKNRAANSGERSHNFGKSLSPETRDKIRKARSGSKHTPETIARMREAHRGHEVSAEQRAKVAAALTGISRSPQTRAKIRAARAKQTFSAETREKMAARLRGKPSMNSGKKAALEAKARMSAAQSGERNARWLGGISRGEYAWTFDRKLKDAIRRRDGYRCRMCGELQAKGQPALDVHHIDYDKKNSDPVNLISLCKSCHTRTNTNREHWKTAFREVAIWDTIARLAVIRDELAAFREY